MATKSELFTATIYQKRLKIIFEIASNKKMPMSTNKKLVPLLFVGALILAGCGQTAPDQGGQQSAGQSNMAGELSGQIAGEAEGDAAISGMTVAVDLSQSVLRWHGERVVGNAHNGTFPLKSGELREAGGQIIGGTVILDMANLTVDDNSGVLRHLKSNDFFGVEQYPEAIITVQSVTPKGADQYSVVADITIKDITKSVLFDAIISNQDGRWRVQAATTVNRLDWGIRFDSIVFFSSVADKAIRDEVPITIDLVARQ